MTVELHYDSDNNILSFFKTCDRLLDSRIVNVPQNKTFYWTVGHGYKPWKYK